MGNEALARGILENGATMATAYPGTPSSEIMAAIQGMAKAENYPIHAEWSINEKWPMKRPWRTPIAAGGSRSA